MSKSTRARRPAHNRTPQMLAAILACTPLLANAAAGNYAYFTDRDSGGGALYGGAPVWVKTAGECQAACSADPICYGWTFSIPSGGDGPCYLKAQGKCDANSLAKVQPAGKYASGIISDACTVTCVGGMTVVVPSRNCAIVTPTPTSTKAANRYRRDTEERQLQAEKNRLCPAGQTACPIGSNIEGGYECVDVSEELESCGACGHDCTSIPGTRDVTCSKGRCIVSSCTPGFALSFTGSCKRIPKLAHRRIKAKAFSQIAHGKRSSAL